MTNLRNLARGAECQIRAPGICSGNSETVVLCHLRMTGISGFGLKAPDALAAYGCQACHDFVDGRTHPNNSAEYRRTLLLEAMARTQYIWIKAGILKW